MTCAAKSLPGVASGSVAARSALGFRAIPSSPASQHHQIMGTFGGGAVHRMLIAFRAVVVRWHAFLPQISNRNGSFDLISIYLFSPYNSLMAESLFL